MSDSSNNIRARIPVTLSGMDEVVDACDVLSMLVQIGDVIYTGQDILEIETDKATLTVPSSAAGRVANIHVDAGDTISVGTTILEVEPLDETSKRDDLPSDEIAARPKEDGLAIGDLEVEQVNAEANSAEELEPAVAGGDRRPVPLRADEFGSFRAEKLSRIRQTIARNMMHSYTSVPQITSFDEVDVTELDQVRQASKAEYATRGIKLTVVPFVIKAVATSLKEFPAINSTIDVENSEVLYKAYINIGVAVDTERGLIVPVLRSADQKSIGQIAKECDQLALAARSGEVALEDLRGGTFTISNLGAIGGLHATPIINPPEAAILLAGAIRPMPRVVDGHLVSRSVMPLSLTYDHRIIDGADAIRFLNRVKDHLSDPRKSLMSNENQDE